MDRRFEMLSMFRANEINLDDRWNSGGICIHASPLQEERELLDLKLIFLLSTSGSVVWHTSVGGRRLEDLNFWLPSLLTSFLFHLSALFLSLFFVLYLLFLYEFGCARDDQWWWSCCHCLFEHSFCGHCH